MSKKSIKRLVILSSVFCFLLFLFIIVILDTEKIYKFDAKIYEMLLPFQKNLILLHFMKIVSVFSDPVFLFLVFILSILLFKNKKIRVGITCNLLGSLSFNQLLKYILKKPRPEVLHFVSASGYSFPSGHAMVSLAFYGFFLYLFNQEKKHKGISCFFFLFIFVIGLSRIVLGVHYASDVFAGFLISFCYLVLFLKIYNIPSKKKNFLKLLNSFQYAFTGIYSSIKTERNMKIHIFMMCFVILFGVILKISYLEWILCIFCFAMVIGGEMVNTAIEEVVDLVTKEYNETAKLAKDISAGSVLVLAFATFIIGGIIFIPKLFILIQ